jgi:hypothetical protein
MIYMGGLTFDSDDPSNFSKIPNLVAAKRFGSAILERLQKREGEAGKRSAGNRIG